jgi:hypothetical protein
MYFCPALRIFACCFINTDIGYKGSGAVVIQPANSEVRFHSLHFLSRYDIIFKPKYRFRFFLKIVCAKNLISEYPVGTFLVLFR